MAESLLELKALGKLALIVSAIPRYRGPSTQAVQRTKKKVGDA